MLKPGARAPRPIARTNLNNMKAISKPMEAECEVSRHKPNERPVPSSTHELVESPVASSIHDLVEPNAPHFQPEMPAGLGCKSSFEFPLLVHSAS
jgi:hypothetical protein